MTVELRDGRVALVTGANRGLGLESVRQLSALGFTVLNLGGIVHLLLVIAVIVLLYQLITGRRVAL